MGYLLVLAASFCFCIQNVIVRILFTSQPLIGIGMIGGFLTPTLHNSFLLLVLRMVLAVPLMAMFTAFVYPPGSSEFWSLRLPSQRSCLLHVIVGGILMFTYLALLYISIGLIPTAIALTLFFTFPIFTALFSWGFLGQKPSLLMGLIIGFILIGSSLTIPPEQWEGEGNLMGVGLGVLSGIAYALYTVNAQVTFRYLHPLVYTWTSFALTLLLSGVCLTVWPIVPTGPLAWVSIWIGSLLSGVATFGGHILYNLGIRQVGATQASMVGAANPAFTVVLAWLTIQESMGWLQLLGVVIVTLSVASLSRLNNPA